MCMDRGQHGRRQTEGYNISSVTVCGFSHKSMTAVVETVGSGTPDAPAVVTRHALRIDASPPVRESLRESPPRVQNEMPRHRGPVGSPEVHSPEGENELHSHTSQQRDGGVDPSDALGERMAHVLR